jgi:FkbM family methyltransferase
MSLRKMAGRIINGPLGSVAGQIVNSSLHRWGLQIVRSDPELRSLPSYGFKTVLDIGASYGVFWQGVRPVLPEAVIHCFEPLPELFAQLRKKVSRDPRTRAWNLALGDADGPAVMHKSDGIFMSSLLPMTETALREFPEATHWTPQEVTVRTLDKWSESQKLEPPILIKMDVQGYEGKVIRGGCATIKQAEVLLLEVSFVELYAGQWLFDQLYDAVRELGYRLVGMTYPQCDQKSGRALQTDALFARNRQAGSVRE